jgi:uncharacterized protein (TIGR00369 family)
MRKIINPFVDIEEHKCFACDPKNRHGLRMAFYEDEDRVIAHWRPKDHFQGYGNILHGGIQTTLMDELASWVVFVKLKTAGVTSRINVQFHKPVYTNRGKITVTGVLQSSDERIATIAAHISDENENMCSESTIDYVLFSPRLARKKLFFPGYEKFFE